MRKLWRLLAATLLLAALTPACSGGGDDEKSLFDGTWVATNARLIFKGSSWRNEKGAEGEFSATGSYPVFTLTMTTRFPAGSTAPAVKQAAFADEDSMRLCDLGTDGVVSNCRDFVRDEPIIPG